MKHLMKNELLRMYSSIEFRIAFGIAMVIAVWHGIYIDIYGEQIGYPIGGYFDCGGVFDCWLGAGTAFAQAYWYYLVMPLIAAFSYAGTIFDDKKNGYIKQVCIRSTRRQYYLTKSLVVFFAGGVSCVSPFIINFGIIAMKYPILYPSLYRGFGPDASEVLGALFWTHPCVYTCLYLLFDFSLCGIIALIAMALCMKMQYKYPAICLPFAVSFLMYELGAVVDTTNIAPLNYMEPQYGLRSVWTLIAVMILGIVAFTTILIMGERNEL